VKFEVSLVRSEVGKYQTKHIQIEYHLTNIKAKFHKSKIKSESVLK